MTNLDTLAACGDKDVVLLLQLEAAQLITRAEFRKNLRKFCPQLELDE